MAESLPSMHGSSPHAEDFPGSKINALIENVFTLWQDTCPSRNAVDFLRYGREPDRGVIASIRRSSTSGEGRHPRQDIATIGDADTDAKKQVLFEKVRAGSIRVLLGSTQKNGHRHQRPEAPRCTPPFGCPWKPAEVEQRDGRILRQGNTNEEVAIYRYVTEGSFDAYMWQALETKARFIAQVMTGASTLRQAEDIGGQELSYAEVKAIASGNPAV